MSDHRFPRRLALGRSTSRARDQDRSSRLRPSRLLRCATAHQRGVRMSNREGPNRWGMTRAEITAAYADDREDELLSAVGTAAALVARSDGRVAPAERGELLDFLDRKGFLLVFT